MYNSELCLALAKTLGLPKAVFLIWVAENEQKPIASDAIFSAFSFMPEEEVYSLMNTLVEEGLISDGYQNNYFRMTLNRHLVQQKTGCVFPLPSAVPAPRVNQKSASPRSAQVMDPSVGNFLKRFKGENGLLDEKLDAVRHHAHSFIEFATQQGLSLEFAKLTFEKFLAYLQSDPQRFYNRDLNSYWAFWVSNAQERQQKSQGTGGKQSALEESNRMLIQSMLDKS